MADAREDTSICIAELERLLREREAALAAAVAELDSFSYGISHDLRSPLRAITGFAQMLEEDCGAKLDDNGRRYLGVIRASAAKLERAIEALLTYTRLGRQELKPAVVNMSALARHAVEALATAEQAESITVLELPETTGDGELLQHVWNNLISNAITYTSRTPQRCIEIGGSRMDDETTWYVRDNGVGFDMRYAQKLFGMFQRMHGDEEFPGIGTGLATARRIITRHGGRIWAEASPEQGATFQFALPVTR